MSAAEENAQIAAQLREAAGLVEAQGGNPFRVGAYRKAADAVAHAPHPVRGREEECRAYYQAAIQGGQT